MLMARMTSESKSLIFDVLLEETVCDHFILFSCRQQRTSQALKSLVEVSRRLTAVDFVAFMLLLDDLQKAVLQPHGRSQQKSGIELWTMERAHCECYPPLVSYTVSEQRKLLKIVPDGKARRVQQAVRNYLLSGFALTGCTGQIQAQKVEKVEPNLNYQQENNEDKAKKPSVQWLRCAQ